MDASGGYWLLLADQVLQVYYLFYFYLRTLAKKLWMDFAQLSEQRYFLPLLGEVLRSDHDVDLRRRVVLHLKAPSVVGGGGLSCRRHYDDLQETILFYVRLENARAQEYLLR